MSEHGGSPQAARQIRAEQVYLLFSPVPPPPDPTQHNPHQVCLTVGLCKTVIW